MPRTPITLAEAGLRWGASIAGVWLFVTCLLLAVAWQSTSLELSWRNTFFLLASLLMGGITWGLFAADKRRAVRSEYRIQEATLFAVTLLGGWTGAFLAQRWLRHKSQRLVFQVTAWCGLLIHLLATLVMFGWL